MVVIPNPIFAAISRQRFRDIAHETRSRALIDEGAEHALLTLAKHQGVIARGLELQITAARRTETET
jgi:hypothetical protein